MKQSIDGSERQEVIVCRLSFHLCWCRRETNNQISINLSTMFTSFAPFELLKLVCCSIRFWIQFLLWILGSNRLEANVGESSLTENNDFVTCMVSCGFVNAFKRDSHLIHKSYAKIFTLNLRFLHRCNVTDASKAIFFNCDQRNAIANASTT